MAEVFRHECNIFIFGMPCVQTLASRLLSLRSFYSEKQTRLINKSVNAKYSDLNSPQFWMCQSLTANYSYISLNSLCVDTGIVILLPAYLSKFESDRQTDRQTCLLMAFIPFPHFGCTESCVIMTGACGVVTVGGEDDVAENEQLPE